MFNLLLKSILFGIKFLNELVFLSLDSAQLCLVSGRQRRRRSNRHCFQRRLTTFELGHFFGQVFVLLSQACDLFLGLDENA